MQTKKRQVSNQKKGVNELGQASSNNSEHGNGSDMRQQPAEEFKKLMEENAALKSANTSLQEQQKMEGIDIVALKKEIEKLKRERNDIQKENQDLKAARAELTKLKDEQAHVITQLKKEKIALKTLLDNKRGAIGRLEADLDLLRETSSQQIKELQETSSDRIRILETARNTQNNARVCAENSRDVASLQFSLLAERFLALKETSEKLQEDLEATVAQKNAYASKLKELCTISSDIATLPGLFDSASSSSPTSMSLAVTSAGATSQSSSTSGSSNTRARLLKRTAPATEQKMENGKKTKM